MGNLVSNEGQPLDRLLSVRQVSQILGSHPHTIYGWVEEGKLPCLRIGSRIKFRESVIEEWLAKRSE